MQFSFDPKLTSRSHYRIVQTIIFISLLMIGSVMVAKAQDSQFPNELSGYEFFKSGRLNGLTLLVSTKDDVIRVIGKSCENNCDYNEDWRISFGYVNSVWYNKTDDKLYRPESKFVGKLWSISFRPKRPVLLTDANVFPKGTSCGKGTTTSGSFTYSSRGCRVDGDGIILYSIANETISDGTVLILKEQIINIGYLPSKKDGDAIYALVEK